MIQELRTLVKEKLFLIAIYINCFNFGFELRNFIYWSNITFNYMNIKNLKCFFSFTIWLNLIILKDYRYFKCMERWTNEASGSVKEYVKEVYKEEETHAWSFLSPSSFLSVRYPLTPPPRFRRYVRIRL